MEVKTIEIRDRITFIPALAVRFTPWQEDPQDEYLFRRAGYREPYVLLVKLTDALSYFHPFDWDERLSGRTMGTAHQYLLDHWDEIPSGSVLDVEYVLGETKTPKVSEKDEVF